MFERILVPVDFSQCSREALHYALALALAKASRGSIVILHVFEPPSFATPDLLVSRPDAGGATILDWVRSEMDRKLEAFLTEAEIPEAVRVERRLVRGDPAHKILEALASEPFDAVVMGTHGRTGVMRFLLGSVAEKVVRASPRPVLTIRSQGRRGEVISMLTSPTEEPRTSPRPEPKIAPRPGDAAHLR